VANVPASDDFADAPEITPLPFTGNTNTGSATASPDDPSDSSVPYNTVWYEFTSGNDSVLEANTFGSDYDTTLTVVTGSPGSFTVIAYNDDAQAGLQSQVIINVSAGVTYYFMVGSKVPGGGNLVFNAQEGGVVTTSTTSVPADCITIEPNSVEVSGTDETLDVTITFTRTDVINIPPDDLEKLAISVDTNCAQYITINSNTINIGATEVTADVNITVLGTAPSSQCSFQIIDSTGVADPPLNCEAAFTISQVSPTTTTTALTTTTTAPTTTTTALTTTTTPSTTTTIPEEECTVTVRSTFLPLNAGLLPHVRRIEITGEGSTWDRTSAVSIEDIPTVIPLRIQPTQINALIIIPSTIFGRFTPGEKAVGVATGAELCTGTVDIP
jgi:hypothetical protein